MIAVAASWSAAAPPATTVSRGRDAAPATAVSHRDGAARRHHADRQLHRHGAAGAERAGRRLRFRARSRRSSWTSTPRSRRASSWRRSIRGLYKAAVAHEEASLAHARPTWLRVKALLEQAMRERAAGPATASRPRPSPRPISTRFVTDRKSLEAQVELAEATIQQCEANLDTAETNLDSPTSSRRSTASSSTARSIRARPWPRSSRRP